MPTRLNRIKNRPIEEWSVYQLGSIDHKLRNKLKRMLNDRME